MRVLVTGAGGFIGGHVREHFETHTQWTVAAPTRPMYDLRFPESLDAIIGGGDIDVIVNIASEAQPGFAYDWPVPSTLSNATLMLHVLELARRVNARLVLHLSTNEVYGPLGDPGQSHDVDAPIDPRSPYAAAKAAQEAICLGYRAAYGVPVTIVNTADVFGERQPEAKLVPTVVRKLMHREPIGLVAPHARRSWIHADEVARALRFLIELDRPLDAKYHVAGPIPMRHDQLVRRVAEHLGIGSWDIEFAESRRAGDADFTTLSDRSLRELGWMVRGQGPPLRQTVDYFARDRA